MNKKRIPITELLILGLALNLVTAGMAPAAHAGAIGTGDYISWQQRDQRLERINAFLSEERVQAQLISLGVDPTSAQQRVASLTAAELAALDQQITDLPAGGNVLVVLGVVFVVLLVLELVGATNIFTGI
jgi:hypothetical protein